MLALQSNDLDTAEAAHREALVIRRTVQDVRGVAVSLTDLGYVALERGQFEQARHFYEECIALWEDLRDDGALARAWNDLGNVANVQGDLSGARSLYLRGLEILRAGRDTRNVAISLYNLAELALGEKDYSDAEMYLKECLSCLEVVEDRYVHAYAIHMLGMLAYHTERDRAAVPLWGAAKAAFDRIEASLKPADSQDFARAERHARERLGASRYVELWREGQAMSLTDAASSMRGIFSSQTESR
jgi:tetratricopeptide (TPR) repeat protein